MRGHHTAFICRGSTPIGELPVFVIKSHVEAPHHIGPTGARLTSIPQWVQPQDSGGFTSECCLS